MKDQFIESPLREHPLIEFWHDLIIYKIEIIQNPSIIRGKLTTPLDLL